MRLSTKGEFGMRAMLELADNFGKGHLAIVNIAKEQELSEKYLENIFKDLKKAGLVVSVRGQSGGYVLSREPSNITVGEVLRAVESTFCIVPCLDSINPKKCKRSNICKCRPAWIKMNTTLNDCADSITLEDLIK